MFKANTETKPQHYHFDFYDFFKDLYLLRSAYLNTLAEILSITAYLDISIKHSIS